VFQPPEGLVEAVNAAVHLRRPLLLTGAPGSGKSSVIDSVAAELGLGVPLRWHITSRSVLSEALYRYDVLGRIHAQQLGQERPGDEDADDISDFLQLGPLGTSLTPGERPKALLIDEFDKSDFDLPGDLLEVLDRGEFEIPELARHKLPEFKIRGWYSAERHLVKRGRVACEAFPIIVITSNGGRDFAAPFLRRCIRFSMPIPGDDLLRKIVRAHLGEQLVEDPSTRQLIDSFADRLAAGDRLAVDQLLNAVFLLSGDQAPGPGRRQELQKLILRELTGP
jgi:MoxR-like ATPase